MTEAHIQRLLAFQRNEITEHLVYLALARRAHGRNREVLEQIASDEFRHYEQFRRHTGVDIQPSKLRMGFYRLCSAVFGITFGIRIMEGGENRAQQAYGTFGGSMPELEPIIQDERGHEQALIVMISEERLSYLGSMVLALNNSIQEFSGIAVGLTFAMGNTGLIGSTILISGLAATFAMSGSEYLSQKAEGAHHAGRSPLKAILYAGGIYLFVVVVIVLPYFLFDNCFAALGVGAFAVLGILMVFTFFVAVVKGLRYRVVLVENLAVSALVVVVSLAIGTLARVFFHASATH